MDNLSFYSIPVELIRIIVDSCDLETVKNLVWVSKCFKENCLESLKIQKMCCLEHMETFKTNSTEGLVDSDVSIINDTEYSNKYGLSPQGWKHTAMCYGKINSYEKELLRVMKKQFSEEIIRNCRTIALLFSGSLMFVLFLGYLLVSLDPSFRQGFLDIFSFSPLKSGGGVFFLLFLFCVYSVHKKLEIVEGDIPFLVRLLVFTPTFIVLPLAFILDDEVSKFIICGVPLTFSMSFFLGFVWKSIDVEVNFFASFWIILLSQLALFFLIGIVVFVVDKVFFPFMELGLVLLIFSPCLLIVPFCLFVGFCFQYSVANSDCLRNSHDKNERFSPEQMDSILRFLYGRKRVSGSACSLYEKWKESAEGLIISSDGADSVKDISKCSLGRGSRKEREVTSSVGAYDDDKETNMLGIFLIGELDDAPYAKRVFSCRRICTLLCGMGCCITAGVLFFMEADRLLNWRVYTGGVGSFVRMLFLAAVCGATLCWVMYENVRRKEKERKVRMMVRRLKGVMKKKKKMLKKLLYAI